MSLPEAVEQNLKEKLEHYILFPIIFAAITGLFAWVLVTGNKVAALEAQQPTIQENLQVIREDVREIRGYLIPAPAGSR